MTSSTFIDLLPHAEGGCLGRCGRELQAYPPLRTKVLQSFIPASLD